MLTRVTLEPTTPLPTPHSAFPTPHSLDWRQYVVTSSTLLDFARCPERLHVREADPDPRHTRHYLALRELHFAAKSWDMRYRVRPETYTTTVLQCPTCNSESTGATCKACGQKRKAITVQRPWAAAARECKVWKGAAEKAGATVIAPDEADDAQAAAQRLAEDPHIAALAQTGAGPFLLRGTWVDDASGLKLPVSAVADYLPGEGPYADALGFLAPTTDAGVDSWLRSAYYGGLHVRAALALDLYNACGEQDRKRVLFVLSETQPPFQPGRRLITPRLLQIGRKQYQDLLTRYAQAVSQGAWPGYDPSGDDAQAWTPLDAETWMSDRPGLFGVTSDK